MKILIIIFIVILSAFPVLAQNATITNGNVKAINCYWQTIEVESELPGITGINEYLKKHSGYQPIKPIKAIKKDGKIYFVWIVRYEICK